MWRPDLRLHMEIEFLAGFMLACLQKNEQASVHG